MKADEIRSMEAGRELDAMVASTFEPKPTYLPKWNKVFNAQIMGPPVESPRGFWICLCIYERGDIQEWHPKPLSTDIAAAWEVVEKLWADAGELLAIERLGSQQGWEWFALFRCGPDDDTPFTEAINGGHSAPLAICRAALLAVMEVES